MCVLLKIEKDRTEAVLGEFIKKESAFSGFNVAGRLRDLDSKEVSAYCRELLWNGWEKFEGWGSLKHPDKGLKVRPLMFFKVNLAGNKGLKTLANAIAISAPRKS